jgi:hypothetical protein
MCGARNRRFSAIPRIAAAGLPVFAVVSILLGAPASAAPPPPIPLLSYSDFADLADQAPTVLRAEIRNAIVVDAARASDVRPGWVRLYIEARVAALLSGPPLAGEAIRYLADVPLDAKGKAPKLNKRQVLLFARTVTGRPGELQLVAPDAQVLWSAEGEARLRGILAELVAPKAPGRIGRVQEALFVPGNLVGEGETQMFLATADGEPASITVTHAPASGGQGSDRRWSVSFSEVLDASGAPPAPATLAWYRLACFLPRTLAPGANVSASPGDKAQAGADYAFVLQQLGSCGRTRK